MRIVEPYAAIYSIEFDALKKIEYCARISHRSEDKITEQSWERFLRFVVIEKGDWSVVEHATASVEFLVDRGITHELVRHRLFSFTQESTRFVNYDKKMEPSFILPVDLSPVGQKHWEIAIDEAEKSYRGILGGSSPQIARSVFPNALASKLIITGNLRNWRHFLIMRTTLESHPQMRQVTIPLLEEFQARIPIFYEDIVPNQKQSIAIAKAR